MPPKKQRTYVRDMQEIRSLEQEILKIQTERDLGYTKLNESQANAVKDAEEYLKKMKASKDYTTKSKKEWAELANTIK